MIFIEQFFVPGVSFHLPADAGLSIPATDEVSDIRALPVERSSGPENCQHDLPGDS